MNWDDIKFFLALMRNGTVRGAANQLRISHSTVARRLSALEQKLSVRLFDRLPTGYVLTSVGEDMLMVAERVEGEIEGLERRISGQDHKLSGRIRVTMVDALATGLLMPHLAEFTETYPDIDLELDVTYEAVNLDYRAADIALRFATNPPDHLIGRRLASCATATYASEEYLLKYDLESANDARWINFSSQEGTADWVRDSAYPDIPAKGLMVNLLVQLAACKSGMGLGMLPCFLGDVEPGLRRLTPGIASPAFELWILTHRDIRSNARVRILSDFIAAAVKSHRPLLEGHGAD